MDIKNLASKANTHKLAVQQGYDLTPAIGDIKQMIAGAVLYFESRLPNSALLNDLLEAKGSLDEITPSKVETVAAIILAAEEKVNAQNNSAKEIFELNQN